VKPGHGPLDAFSSLEPTASKSSDSGVTTLKFLLTTTIASILAASVCGAAYANDLGEDGAWQFKGAAQAQIDQQNLALIEAHTQSTTQQSTLSGSGGLGTATGLLSASNAPTNNFTQVVNETTISCAGAGTVCTATGGANTTSVTASSTGSTTSNTNNVTGNTVSETANSNNAGSNNNNPVVTPTNTNNGTLTNGQNSTLGSGGL
jgi:hypothetical protein